MISSNRNSTSAAAIVNHSVLHPTPTKSHNRPLQNATPSKKSITSHHDQHIHLAVPSSASSHTHTPPVQSSNHKAKGLSPHSQSSFHTLSSAAKMVHPSISSKEISKPQTDKHRNDGSPMRAVVSYALPDNIMMTLMMIILMMMMLMILILMM